MKLPYSSSVQNFWNYLHKPSSVRWKEWKTWVSVEHAISGSLYSIWCLCVCVCVCVCVYLCLFVCTACMCVPICVCMIMFMCACQVCMLDGLWSIGDTLRLKQVFNIM